MNYSPTFLNHIDSVSRSIAPAAKSSEAYPQCMTLHGPFPNCPNHPADEMVYTKARLEHALKVFRQTAPHRGRRGLSDAHLGWYMERRLRDTTTKAPRQKGFQNWNFSVVENDAEEDEYDPDEENRMLAASRKKNKKKKEANMKRKAADEDEQQGPSKRRKGEELPHRIEEAGFVTLTLTTQKAKAKLQELLQGLRIVRGNSAQMTPEKTRKYNERKEASDEARRRARLGVDLQSGGVLMDMDDVADMIVDPSNVHDIQEWYGRTSLRSGRVLKKEVKNKVNDDNDGNDVENGVPLPDRAEETIEVQQHEQSAPVPPSISQSTSIIGESSTQPIEIDTSDDEQPEEAKQIEYSSTSTRPKIGRPIHALSRINRSLTPRERNTPSQFRHEPEIKHFKSSFVHPINFKSMPLRPSESYCDFCSDWTMGVLGHKKRNAIAFRNPRDPNGFTFRDNHRGDPRPPTKMCVKCSLGRHFIMTCHSPKHASAVNESDPKFMRINSGKFNSEQINSYFDFLFPEERKKPWLRGQRAGPLPVCSLCPQPASWRCCKWQKFDIARRPCRVPDVASQGRTAASAVVSLSSSGGHRTSNGVSALRGQQTEPEVISLLDSSDEEESTSSPAAPDKSVRTPPSPLSSSQTTNTASTSMSLQTQTRPSKFEVRPHPDPLPASTPPDPSSPPPQSPPPSSTTTKPSTPLRPPIQGCGLQLCKSCHRFLNTTSTCNGLLHQGIVMKYLQESRLNARADMEWLFEGSLLQIRVEERGGRGGRG